MFISQTHTLAITAAVLCACFSMNSVTGFFAPGVLTHTNNMLMSSESSTLLRDSEDDGAAPLPLTVSDLQRLTAVQTRHKTIPLLIMDAVVPGQTISFSSNDPRFHSLVHYVLSGGKDIGMVGMNPQTGRPMNIGATLPVTPDNVSVNQQTKAVTLTVQAKGRFEVQGEPWLFDDPTITRSEDDDDDNIMDNAAFYMADVETVDSRKEEPLSDEAAVTTQHLADQLPNLIGSWVHHLVATNKADALKMESRMMDLGPLPGDWTEQALWVAALLNPTSGAEERVCLEIRPAMLSCTSDHDRMLLATAALQSSIDHVSGKKRLL